MQYQLECLQFQKNVEQQFGGGIIADGMGMGKTGLSPLPSD